MLWYHASCLAKLMRYPKGCRATWQPPETVEPPKADTGEERNRRPEEQSYEVDLSGLQAAS
jgi:hypothetical protein